MNPTHLTGTIAVAAAALAAGLALSHGATVPSAGAEAALQEGARPTRVAVVNTSLIVGKLDEAGDRLGIIRVQVEQRQTEIDDLTTRMETLESDLEMLELSPEQRDQKRVEQFQLNAQRQALREAYTQLLDQQQGRIFAEMQEKIIDAAGRIAQAEGYDMLLQDDRWIGLPQNRGEADVLRQIQFRSVLWASPENDITQRVLDEMNQLYRAGGNGE
ncbi:MAG: OmpH family outer membrane protein [Planctomycetota bacterium]